MFRTVHTEKNAYGIVTAKALRIRAEPYLGAKGVGKLLRGQRVNIVAMTDHMWVVDNINDHWFLVKDRGEIKGWVFGGYLNVHWSEKIRFVEVFRAEAAPERGVAEGAWAIDEPISPGNILTVLNSTPCYIRTQTSTTLNDGVDYYYGALVEDMTCAGVLEAPRLAVYGERVFDFGVLPNLPPSPQELAALTKTLEWEHKEVIWRKFSENESLRAADGPTLGPPARIWRNVANGENILFAAFDQPWMAVMLRRGKVTVLDAAENTCGRVGIAFRLNGRFYYSYAEGPCETDATGTDIIELE